MRKLVFSSLMLVALALVTSGCAGGFQAARGSGGGPITLEVAFDRNPNAPNPDQIAQLTDWMAPDLENMLRRAGYEVVSQPNAAAFRPGPDRYLVVVYIDDYDAGNKAARMLVGFGAGRLTLNTRNGLYSGPGQLVFSSIGSVGSSRDWKNAARKINESIARDFSAALER